MLDELIRQIQFYQTTPHPCSYLDDQNAVTAFVDPETIIPKGTYEELSRLGFRRSGSYLYKPICAQCNACIPVRVPTANFSPSKTQKRCLKRNKDLSVKLKKHMDLEQHYALYAEYISNRHADGDMFPPSENQFLEFINHKRDETQFLEFRLEGSLIGCAVIDILPRSLSAIYTYYDPRLSSRSLGKFAILYQIELAKQMKLDHVYLGYWIKDSQKMNYKADYRPMEIFNKNMWNLIE